MTPCLMLKFLFFKIWCHIKYLIIVQFKDILVHFLRSVIAGNRGSYWVLGPVLGERENKYVLLLTSKIIVGKRKETLMVWFSL